MVYKTYTCLLCESTKTKTKKKYFPTTGTIGIYSEWYNHKGGKICHNCYSKIQYQKKHKKLSIEEWRERNKNNPLWQKGINHPNYGKKLTEETKKKMSISHKAEKHWNWQGGIKFNSAGYVLVYAPDHPKADKDGYVREHRLVMEEYLGRYLDKNEIPHHKNGNKKDNRIENLQLMTESQHDKLSRLF